MKKLDQNQAPIYEALVKLRKKRIVPFDVPGHKRGRGNPELVELLGEKCVGIDVNSMKPLDNLGHPISIIRDAEGLAADAFGAAHAFLMIGGTTSSVQTRQEIRLFCHEMSINLLSMRWFYVVPFPSISR